jgi:NADH-quinone oxidoreductase subunit N
VYSNLYYYLFTYGLATVGAFGVLAVLEHNGIPAQNLSDLAGLWKRSRLLGGSLLVFVLSLAGVPPLAGFMAKFFVFRDALIAAKTLPFGDALFAAVLLAIALTVVGLFYYLQILRQTFITEPQAGAAPLRTPVCARIALVLAAALIIFLGVFPF